MLTWRKKSLKDRQCLDSDAMPAWRHRLKKARLGVLAAILYIPGRDNNPVHRGT